MRDSIPSPEPLSVQEAAAAAVVALINSSPRSPRQEEIEAILGHIAPDAHVCATGNNRTSLLRTEIAKATAQATKALHVMANLRAGAEHDLAEADLDYWEERVEQLEGEIPNPPQCFEDLVARAEIALHGGDVVDGKLMEAENHEDVFLGPAARLIEAVLQFPRTTSMTAMSPAHAAYYREWRGLIDQHMLEFENADETGMTKAEINAEEDRLAAHMGTIDALARRTFAVPARTWGDVVLLAEVCLWCHAPGTTPDAPAGSSDLQDSFSCLGELPDLASAKLLEAIFVVAGVGQFAEARHG